jgi:hypothetical protein
METQGITSVVLGGLMVGIAAGLVLVANGRIAGVSGMVASAVRPKTADAAWQALFLAGLVAGGALLYWLDPAALPADEAAPVQIIAGAGLLVGFGVRKAGASASRLIRLRVGRLSRRFAAAAVCFLVAGVAALWIG